MWIKKFFQGIYKYGLIWLLFGIILGASVYYLWLHRFPFTQNAFLVANTRVVSALVPGYIEELHIRNNTEIRKGEPLLTIFRQPYQLKMEQTEHALEAEEASAKKLEAQILQADALIRQRQAELKNAQYLAVQAKEMYKTLAVSQAYMEEKAQEMEALAAQTEEAVHQKTALGHELIQTQANIKRIAKELELSKIYYEWTVVRAQSDGLVTNMYVAPGAYVNAGEVLFGCIDTSEWFVQANFKETELSQIRPGQEALIWLWQYPGKVFHGVVLETGWGVERRLTAESTGMARVEKENEWFLLPQRFPVQIRVLDPDPAHPFHLGGSAFVQVNTPAYPFRQFIWQLFQI